ncbi:MAG TPA: response regulator [Chitinophagaceae bacterium]|nr:response regulator [Chitinophagaceae bacterium]
MKPMNILLADDDADDCFFFEKALREIPMATQLTAVNDGERLMDHLSKNPEHLPDVLFLDLNMPRKTGYECLTEITETLLLKEIPVVMFSTSYTLDRNYEQNMINVLYKMGAQDYIRKPGNFAELKELIHQSLTRLAEKRSLKEKTRN